MRLALRIVDPTTKECQSQFNISSGEKKTLAFQVYDVDKDAPAVVASGITSMSLTLPATSTLTKTNTDIIQSSVSSVFSVSITVANSVIMQTGNISFTWTEGAAPNDKIYVAVGELLIKKQVNYA